MFIVKTIKWNITKAVKTGITLGIFWVTLIYLKWTVSQYATQVIIVIIRNDNRISNTCSIMNYVGSKY